MLSRSASWVYFLLQELLDSDADSDMRVVRLHTRGVSISNQLLQYRRGPLAYYKYLKTAAHSQRHL